MSAYQKQKTNITEGRFLVEALRQLGYEPHVHEQPVTLRDGHGNALQATIVVPKEQLVNEHGGRNSYASLGFIERDGQFEAVIDNWDRQGGYYGHYGTKWFEGLQDVYKERQQIAVAEEQGYVLSDRQEIVMEDGTKKYELVFTERGW